jgi:hypothetical protein
MALFRLEGPDAKPTLPEWVVAAIFLSYLILQYYSVLVFLLLGIDWPCFVFAWLSLNFAMFITGCAALGCAAS